MDTLIVACRDGKVNDQVIDVCTIGGHGDESRMECDPRETYQSGAFGGMIDKLTSLPLHARRMLVPLYTGMIDALKSKETMKPAVIKLYLAMVEWSQADQAALHVDPVIQMVDTQPHLLDYVYRQIAQAPMPARRIGARRRC